MRQIVGTTLSSAGHAVVAAEDGQAAFEFAQREVVDIVITDINMPRMDGITLVRKLRELPTYRLVPLLILTTESNADKKLAGKSAGATGWIVKPFNPERLLATVMKVLG
jgi:two-component system, chemotaxis family, chemotaxis protein CheY